MRTFSEIQEAREYDVIIVGSGAAGFGTACRLIDAGKKSKDSDGYCNGRTVQRLEIRKGGSPLDRTQSHK